MLTAAAVSGILGSDGRLDATEVDICSRMSEFAEAASLIGAAADPVPAPQMLRQQILDQVGRLGAGTGKGAVPLAVKTNADEGWHRHAVSGVRYKELAEQSADNSVMMLLEISAGVKFPGHKHHGAERCLVVSGSFFFDDRKYVQGDFIDAPPGTTDPVLYTPEGTTLLLVVDRQDYAIAAS